MLGIGDAASVVEDQPWRITGVHGSRTTRGVGETGTGSLARDGWLGCRGVSLPEEHGTPSRLSDSGGRWLARRNGTGYYSDRADSPGVRDLSTTELPRGEVHRAFQDRVPIVSGRPLLPRRPHSFHAILPQMRRPDSRREADALLRGLQAIPGHPIAPIAKALALGVARSRWVVPCVGVVRSLNGAGLPPVPLDRSLSGHRRGWLGVAADGRTWLSSAISHVGLAPWLRRRPILAGHLGDGRGAPINDSGKLSQWPPGSTFCLKMSTAWRS